MPGSCNPKMEPIRRSEVRSVKICFLLFHIDVCGMGARPRRGGWSFSMRPGSRRTWRPGGDWADVYVRRSRMALKPLTFIAALRCDRIDAPWFIDAPINGELLTLYIERILVPTLAEGDIVILDNLGSHKDQAYRAVQAAGAHLNQAQLCGRRILQIRAA
ncbi:transposase [Rhizobium sp. K102]|uniref:transposase n=1 Tax=Rhizobium sp. K102 TaxID=2918527 RepID=UPI0031F2E4D0